MKTDIIALIVFFMMGFNLCIPVIQKQFTEEIDSVVAKAGPLGDGPPFNDWWNSDWSYSKKITIDHTKIDAALTNFPVLISNTSSDFASHARSDGYDFRFLDATNETECYFEIEDYDSETGTLIAWVNVTSLSSIADTVLYCYYGNSSADVDPSSTSTWDSNYCAVYHMSDSTTTDKLTDSTVNEYDSIAKNSDPAYEQTGAIHHAINYDQNDGHEIPAIISTAQLDAGYSLEAWANFDAMAISPAMICLDRDSRIFLNLRNVDGYHACFQTIDADNTAWDFLYGTEVVPTTEWRSFTATYDGTNKYLYTNGSDEQTSVWGPTYDNNAKNTIGNVAVYDQGAQGYVDEVRISSIGRSANWISTTYATQSSPSTFADYGSEESPENYPPTQSGETPSDGAIDIPSTPSLHVICTDLDSDTMTATWMSNSSESWVAFATNTSIDTGTNITQTNANFSEYDTTYYWRVCLTDGSKWTNNTYHFTTATSAKEWVTLDTWNLTMGNLTINPFTIDTWNLTLSNTTVKPDPPSVFTATADGQTEIDITWIKGAGADKTYIEWKPSGSWNRGDGTYLYNDTGVSTSDSGLAPGTTRCYQGWSYNDTNNTWSITCGSDCATTESPPSPPPPLPPYNPPSIANEYPPDTWPTITNETPTNQSIEQNLIVNWTVYIADPNGDAINWTIYCSNGQNNSGVLDTNGTKNVTLTGLDECTTYTVFVNVTDGTNWVRKWYVFTTVLITFYGRFTYVLEGEMVVITPILQGVTHYQWTVVHETGVTGGVTPWIAIEDVCNYTLGFVYLTAIRVTLSIKNVVVNRIGNYSEKITIYKSSYEKSEPSIDEPTPDSTNIFKEGADAVGKWIGERNTGELLFMVIIAIIVPLLIIRKKLPCKRIISTVLKKGKKEKE